MPGGVPATGVRQLFGGKATGGRPPGLKRKRRRKEEEEEKEKKKKGRGGARLGGDSHRRRAGLPATVDLPTWWNRERVRERWRERQ